MRRAAERGHPDGRLVSEGSTSAAVCRDTSLRRRLILYHGAYLAQVSQAVGCNGLHTVHQRCCRWLLMTQDRAHSDVFAMTHKVTVLNRASLKADSCECCRRVNEEFQQVFTGTEGGA